MEKLEKSVCSDHMQMVKVNHQTETCDQQLQIWSMMDHFQALL